MFVRKKQKRFLAISMYKGHLFQFLAPQSLKEQELMLVLHLSKFKSATPALVWWHKLPPVNVVFEILRGSFVLPKIQ